MKNHFWRSLPPQGKTGLLLLGATVLACLLGPVVWPASAYDLKDGLRYAPPGPGLPLGADELGRDALARLLLGGRYSLAAALLGALLATAAGLALGLWAGWRRGLADEGIGAVVDLLLSLPLISLALIVAAADPKKMGLGDWFYSPPGQVLRIALLLGFLNWMGVQRLVRAETRRTSSLAYCEAAQAAGAGAGWLLWRVILPGVWPTVTVAFTFLFGGALLLESTLSYLGVGISPPAPTWGNLLRAAQEYFFRAPHLLLAPGLMLFAAALGANLLGSSARNVRA